MTLQGVPPLVWVLNPGHGDVATYWIKVCCILAAIRTISAQTCVHFLCWQSALMFLPVYCITTSPSRSVCVHPPSPHRHHLPST